MSSELKQKAGEYHHPATLKLVGSFGIGTVERIQRDAFLAGAKALVELAEEKARKFHYSYEEQGLLVEVTAVFLSDLKRLGGKEP